MRVMVTDGDTRAALAITRSLGRIGHLVFVGEKRLPSLASVSVHCHKSFSYPDPSQESRGFIETLLKEAAENGIEVVIPVADITTLLVTERMDEFRRYCAVPFPPYGTVDLAARKDRLVEAAMALGIPVPRTVVITGPGEARGLAQHGLGFPVVVKPHRSRIKTPGGRWVFTSVSYASDERELEGVLEAKRGQYPLLLQERINGPGIGVFACYDKGTLKAIFSHRRLREKPPSGGVSVLRESIPVREDARKYTEALLGHLGWHGVAMVEFKQDERDGVVKLMEVNGRFWGSLQLAIDAGVDFPAILMGIVQGRDVRPCVEYRAGVKTRWLWGDIDALLMVLLKGRGGLQLPPGYPGRLRCLLRFLKPSLKDTHFEVLRLSDPRPWLYETSRWFMAQFLGRG